MSFISMLTLAMAAAAPPQPTISATSPDRSFNIIGFYCNDAVCDATPRPLGDELVFDRSTIPTLFANLPRHRKNWSVWLNCAVSRNKLKQCQLDDETDKSSIGEPVARQLAKRLSLVDVRAKAPRALVLISYEIGNCPRWDCIIEPPPPPPPGSSPG